MTTRLWNNGAPVWNKGQAMKPPFVCTCAACGHPMSIAYGAASGRNRIYRAKRGGATYCSKACHRKATSAKISRTLQGHVLAPHIVAALRSGIRKMWADPVRRARIVAANLGRKASDTERAHKRSAWYRSDASQHHLALIQATYAGAKSPHWKGGITPQHRLERNNSRVRRWAKTVKERDHHTCQLCGVPGGKELHADHVQSFAAHPELRYELSNGRTLCIDCHRKTPNWGYRGKRRTAA